MSSLQPTRPDRHPRARALRYAVPCLLLVGCTSVSDLSGIWRASGPTDDPMLSADVGSGRGVGIELYLGHYGPGAAGVLRYFETDEFLAPLADGPPLFECPCAYLDRARWERDASTLVFEIDGCLPRHAGEGAARVRGRLERLDGELVGAWTIEHGADDGSLESHVIPLTFVEHRGIGDATSDELLCEPTASDEQADAGQGGG